MNETEFVLKCYQFINEESPAGNQIDSYYTTPDKGLINLSINEN